MVLRQQKHHGQCVILCEHELPTSRYEYIGREQLLILSIISVVVVRDYPKATNSIWSLAAVAHTFRRRRRPCRNQNAQLRTNICPPRLHRSTTSSRLEARQRKRQPTHLQPSQTNTQATTGRNRTHARLLQYTILYYCNAPALIS
jgi:hypothetical protein